MRQLTASDHKTGLRSLGARPPLGMRIVSAATPLHVISQEITEFEFHISPAPSSSRPQTGVGTEVRKIEQSLRLTAGHRSVAPGLATASTMSGMTPSRQQRTS